MDTEKFQVEHLTCGSEGEAMAGVLASLVEAGLVVDGRLAEGALWRLAAGFLLELRVLSGLEDGEVLPGRLLSLLVGVTFGADGERKASIEKLTRDDGAIMVRFVYEPSSPPGSEENRH